MAMRKTTLAGLVTFFLMFLIGVSGAGAEKLMSIYAGGAPRLENPRPFQQEEPPPAQGVGLPGADEAIQEALRRAVEQNPTLFLAFQVYDVVVDHIQYSQDGSVALVWLALRDQETGEIVESEPGLSIASNPGLNAPASPDSWTILLSETPTFLEQLQALPAELLTQDIQDRFLNVPAEFKLDSLSSVLTGYKLPWTAGTSKRITNSIGHVYTVSGGLTSCATTCRYAYDFADGTMFPLIAAKGGRVKAVKWTCVNGDTNCTNYLILEDESTSPTSYQVYYHLAYNSTPTRLRTLGAFVLQGEYIGDVDDTGYSTGHHLHYHVYTTPGRSDWSWGTSVDFKFDDVTTNGGYPRTCAEAREYPNLGAECNTSNLYTSGNTPAHPPTGTLDAPANRQWANTRTLRVQGTATDNIQITRILVIANYDGTWKTIDEIKPAGNGPYAKDVDLCAAGVPDGPLALTVRIYDREGSLAPNIPVRQVIKNFNCTTVPPPTVSACTPGANEVALYANPDFDGACQKFAAGSTGYTASSFGALGNDNAASVQVGSNVMAILYDQSADATAAKPAGRVETLLASDAGLADNAIGSDRVSGLRVVSRSTAPLAPILNPIGNRLTGNNPTSVDSLVLSWEGGGGAASFDTRLTGPGTDLSRTVTGNSLSVGSLNAGSYTFTVTARNPSGSASVSTTFTVASASLPNETARSVPFSDNMESGLNGWTASGLWRQASIEIGSKAATKAWIYNNSTNYADGTFRAGDLTSPPIALPASGTYYLRFMYFMDTESGWPHWDQRRVQISVNGGRFEDLRQMTDDKQQIGQVWLNSGPISLQAYAGKTIRLRFHFDNIDEDYNTGKGWVIDDVSINTTAPNTACADNNNTPQTAQAIALGSLTTAAICPEGDLDYYRFTAKAGQPLVVDIDARTLSPASKLDSLVQLIDADGSSVLFENDDEKYGSMQDSLLAYSIRRDGTYYIKVKAWNHPGVGGTDFPYRMAAHANVPVPPQSVQVLYPSGQKVPAVPFTISAGAVDFDGGPVASVDFYWHGPDWNQGWVKLGSDTNGADGWTMNVTPATYGNVRGSALYVQAVSRTGGVRGVVVWDLEPDLSTPTSKMSGLSAQVNSTVVELKWTASDPTDDLDLFEIQYQVSTGGAYSAWQNWNKPLPGYLRSAWFSGAAGSSYRFRMRAIDQAGNVEAYPDSYEAGTKLASACTPDANEKGQTSDSLVLIAAAQPSPLFNFCKSTQDGSGDVDWTAFDAAANQNMLMMFLPKGGGARMRVSIYNGQSQLLGTWLAADHQTAVVENFLAPATGRYYVEIKPAETSQFGTEMTYQVIISLANRTLLPAVMR